MRVLLMDNYDSFTYNLVHAIEPLVEELVVWRNDEFKIEDVASFDKIFFSPGPSLPIEAGLMTEVIDTYVAKIPMFGVCLGFQALIEHFGGELINLESVRHGIQKKITTKEDSFFSGLLAEQEVGLYHSWAVNQKDIPTNISVLAWDAENVVMAMEDEKNKIAGVQFHPESVMTPNGNRMLENWIKKEY